MAHATNPQAVKAAMRLGAHSVEHGYIMDDECIELMLEHDVWYVPTLAISHLTPGQAGNEWESASSRSATLRRRSAAARMLRRDEHAGWFRRRSMPV